VATSEKLALKTHTSSLNMQLWSLNCGIPQRGNCLDFLWGKMSIRPLWNRRTFKLYAAVLVCTKCRKNPWCGASVL